MPNLQPIQQSYVKKRDQLFARSSYPKPFCFNHEVAAVFDDMLRRSIPLYEENLMNALNYAALFQQPHSFIYDIGCSTGNLVMGLDALVDPSITVCGIDNSQPMLEKAQKKLKNTPTCSRIVWLCQDVSTTVLKPSCIIFLNYTLQFIPVIQRQALLDKIYKSLLPGGLLYLSEKVVAPSAHLQEAYTKIYEEFKRTQGYSQTEIERKKEALDGVLIPFTRLELERRLEQVGFLKKEPVVSWNNFLSLACVKE